MTIGRIACKYNLYKCSIYFLLFIFNDDMFKIHKGLIIKKDI
jgi:hypothetical protein